MQKMWYSSNCGETSEKVQQPGNPKVSLSVAFVSHHAINCSFNHSPSIKFMRPDIAHQFTSANIRHLPSPWVNKIYKILSKGNCLRSFLARDPSRNGKCCRKNERVGPTAVELPPPSPPESIASRPFYSGHPGEPFSNRLTSAREVSRPPSFGASRIIRAFPFP